MAINLNLELTDHCNIKCKMCSQSLRDDAHGAPHRFMEWETWRSMLRGLDDLEDEVHLCPHWLGEPTIHPQFDRFVEYAFAVNADGRLFREFKLHTNAIVFGEDRARLLVRLANSPTGPASCFRFVHFSIDAFTRPVYEEVKGADRRERVFANVERFLRVRQEMGGELPYANIAFVVQPDNSQEAAAFLAHWSGILQELGRPFDVCWDWPHQDRDAIYFRPLNCGEQEDADRLHADTCAALGISPPGQERLRRPESF